MKKISILIIAILTFMPGVGLSQTTTIKTISLHYNADDFIFENIEGKTIISTTKPFVMPLDTLCPALPLMCVNVLVGQGDQFKNIEVSRTETLVGSEIDMAPNVKSVPTNQRVSNKALQNVTYSNLSYPDSFVEYAGTHEIGGCRILCFLLSPFRYDAVQKQLFISSNISFSISLSSTQGDCSYTASTSVRNSIKSLVVNPDDMDLLYGITGITSRDMDRTIVQADSCAYLIVTCDSMKNIFQSLADWKTTKGVKAKVITVEDIYSSSSNKPLQIKQAIKQYYQASSNKLEFVLLGGGANIIPHRYCYSRYGSDTANSPSDMYYASLKNLDWDTNQNGKHGELEDSLDIAFDVIVGRLPADNLLQAGSMVERIINYEKNPNTDNWKNEMLMCATDTSRYCIYEGATVSIAHSTSERMYSQYIATIPWEGNKFRFYDTGTDNGNGSNYDVTSQNLQTELGKGYSFVNVNAHGNSICWGMEDGGGYRYFEAENLQNQGSSIIVTEACDTNNSWPGRCLGYEFMKNLQGGILAYYGCTDYAYGNGLGLLGAIDHLNGYMFNHLFNSRPSILGRSINQSKLWSLGHLDTYSIERWHYLFMLPLCDPEMRVYTRIPTRFTNLNVSPNGDYFNIYYNNEDRFNCCVMSRLDKGASYYNYQENCQSPFSIHNLPGEYIICVTSNDLIPYRTIWGDIVYLQNETLDNCLNVTAHTVYIGSNVISDRESGPVVVDKGESVIYGRYGVTIANDFEVKTGASLIITTN